MNIEQWMVKETVSAIEALNNDYEALRSRRSKLLTDIDKARILASSGTDTNPGNTISKASKYRSELVVCDSLEIALLRRKADIVQSIRIDAKQEVKRLQEAIAKREGEITATLEGVGTSPGVIHTAKVTDKALRDLRLSLNGVDSKIHMPELSENDIELKQKLEGRIDKVFAVS